MTSIAAHTAKTAQPARSLTILSGVRAPVVAWACFGALCLSFQAYLVVRWLVAGKLHVDLGTEHHLALWPTIALRGWEVWLVVLNIFAVVWIVIQCRRERRFAFDAALYLGFLTTAWLDPAMSYRHIGMLYSDAAVHVPTWGVFIPGWQTPGGADKAQPLMGSSMGYGAGFVAMLMLGYAISYLFPRLKLPMSGPGFVVAALVFAALFEIPFEGAYLQSGIYAYAIGLPELTLLSGALHQIPLLNVVAVGVFWIGIPCVIRHFYYRSGDESTILRGSHLLAPRLSPFARTLALIGLMNLSLIACTASFWLISLLGGDTITDLPSVMH